MRRRFLIPSLMVVALVGLRLPALAAPAGPRGPTSLSAASESDSPSARIPPPLFRRHVSLRFTNRRGSAVLSGRVGWFGFYASACIVHVPVRLLAGHSFLGEVHTNELGRFSATCSCSPPLRAVATKLDLGSTGVCLRAVGRVVA